VEERGEAKEESASRRPDSRLEKTVKTSPISQKSLDVEPLDVPGFGFESSRILALRRVLQKPKKEQSAWGWLFTRRISIYVTLLLSRTSVTPNQLTFFSIFIGLAGALLWTVGSHLCFIIGGILFQLMYLFDCVDGELARYKNMTSPRGAYLDFVGHYFTGFAMIIGASLGLTKSLGIVMLYFGLVIAIFHLGDELLRDLLYKAKLKFSAGPDFKELEEKFSFRSEGSSSRVFRFVALVAGSMGFYGGMLAAATIDLWLDSNFIKIGFMIAWGMLCLIRFTVRFWRIYDKAFAV
jgi:phosphatidylglycerophosphate synthase